MRNFQIMIPLFLASKAPVLTASNVQSDVDSNIFLDKHVLLYGWQVNLLLLGQCKTPELADVR